MLCLMDSRQPERVEPQKVVMLKQISPERGCGGG